MFEYRHAAYNVYTGQIINCAHGNQLKRAVALTKAFDKEHYHTGGQWRFCHDYGRKWSKIGAPWR